MLTDSADSSGGSRGNESGFQRRAISELTDSGGKQNIDASYQDPLGPAAERPKTAARNTRMDDEFDDFEVDDNLLPD